MRFALLLLLALLHFPVQAAEPYDLRGMGVSGQAFQLAQQRGRVAMVFCWSTGCAVCRDKLP